MLIKGLKREFLVFFNKLGTLKNGRKCTIKSPKAEPLGSKSAALVGNWLFYRRATAFG